jgi:hypothetical protein
MKSHQENSWVEHQQLVLSELKRQGKWLESLDRRLGDLRVEVAKLQVKSGLWGAVAGGVMTVIVIVVKIFSMGG